MVGEMRKGYGIYRKGSTLTNDRALAKRRGGPRFVDPARFAKLVEMGHLVVEEGADE